MNGRDDTDTKKKNINPNKVPVMIITSNTAVSDIEDLDIEEAEIVYNHHFKKK